MKSRIRSLAIKVLPKWAVKPIRPFWKACLAVGISRTKSIFEIAADEPSYLDYRELETLQAKYPFPTVLGRDAKSLEEKGIKRSRQLLRLEGANEAHSFLEIGCSDAMVCCCLSREGKKTTAIDINGARFDERASREGVRLFQMDAANLQFDDETFDFAFSYNAFEHFKLPGKVLQELVRVVRKGAYIYLEFGPLYYSPFGAHAYRSITVPYCQFLFKKDLLNEFVNQKGLEPIEWNLMNEFPLEKYREFLKKYLPALKTIFYEEYLDYYYLNLIRQYPSCFKSKSSYFDNFIVSRIFVLFQKMDQQYSPGCVLDGEN